ncbi:MAG: MFS transporter [Eubacterium sp.]
MKLKETVSSFLHNFKKYWKIPPKGRYMSFKEIFSLSVGGIGVKFVYYCVNNMILSVGNSLIGNTIGIDPKPMYVIYLLGILSSFPLTALRAKMIDNTKSMKGKYRPYILTMGIPTVILGIGFIWMPYEHFSLFWKCAIVLAFNVGFQFFYTFYNDVNDSIVNVLSSNSVERSDVNSIKAVVENFSPSIANIFLPLVARMITGENTLYDLRIYRIIYPPMLLVGFLISLLIYTNTQEKIVQAKTHVIQMKFSDAFRAIIRNKYFWIISLASWLGFLEGSFNNIIGWLYNYQKAATAGQYVIITAIAGNAAFWPNLVAPFLIRKYGKKKILVYTNLLNIGFIALMLPIIKMTGSPIIIWALLFITFINTFMSSLGHLMSPSLQADIRDYQQYITGERIDGMFAAVGLIGNVITLATSSVLPMIYEKSGLNRTVALSLGYDGSNVYDVLYNREYFISICSVLIIASVVGAIMNVIPFFFYDLTEVKQKAMITVLKIRALFEDYGNNILSDEALVETVDIIKEAEEYSDREITPLSKNEIKQAKKTKNKALIKEAKAKYKAQREENEKIEIAGFVMRELHRFETPEGIAEKENANRLVNAGLDGFLNVQTITRAQAKAMPRNTQEEKDRRRDALIQISKIKTAKKAVKKYFPNGIEEFDSSVFETLFKAEDDNELALHETLSSLKTAKENKDKAAAANIKKQVKALQLQKAKIKEEIKEATNQNSIYYRAAKPYLDAKRTLVQVKNYSNLNEIMSLYDDANERIRCKEDRCLEAATN